MDTDHDLIKLISMKGCPQFVSKDSIISVGRHSYGPGYTKMGSKVKIKVPGGGTKFIYVIDKVSYVLYLSGVSSPLYRTDEFKISDRNFYARKARDLKI